MASLKQCQLEGGGVPDVGHGIEKKYLKQIFKTNINMRMDWNCNGDIFIEGYTFKSC